MIMLRAGVSVNTSDEPPSGIKESRALAWGDDEAGHDALVDGGQDAVLVDVNVHGVAGRTGDPGCEHALVDGADDPVAVEGGDFASVLRAGRGGVAVGVDGLYVRRVQAELDP